MWWVLGFALLSAAPCSGRVVSVPDLHGDYDRAVQILRAAGLVGKRSLSWTGGNTTLVQTGDITDRGDDSRKIYELFFRLRHEAKEDGGAVINVLGNHELMNLQNDLRYVTDGDTQEFGGQDKRQHDWAPDGWLGREVRKFPAAVVAGKVLFAHAGVMPKLLENHRTVQELNGEMTSALYAVGTSREGSFNYLLTDQGPVWTRFYAGRSPRICSTVEAVLAQTGAYRMVLGHTIQQSIKGFRVKSSCEGRLVLGDTAVSRAYGGEMSYIEHDGAGGAVVSYPGLGQKMSLPMPPGAPGTSVAPEL